MEGTAAGTRADMPEEASAGTEEVEDMAVAEVTAEAGTVIDREEARNGGKREWIFL
ncbi:MAG: hypothetical protein JWQ02_3805 [Capsulimonas sp.]|nr:hypothetical protein [Capsulimonas sp.]